MKNGSSIKEGDEVAFAVKDEKANKLVWMTGWVTAILSSREAKQRKLLKSRRSGRVLEIKTGSGHTFYKWCAVCKWPEEIPTT